MRFFLIAAGAVAAIAIASPVLAQQATTNPPPAGANAAAPAQSLNRMPAGGRATSERGVPGSVERSHHRRHATHATHTTHSSRAQSTGNAAQLNRQELGNIQSGNQGQSGNESGNPTTTNRMSVGGRATSGGNR
jgi:hypothetical protein